MASRGIQVISTLLAESFRSSPALLACILSPTRRRSVRARSLRRAFERLGPTYVKLGQLISVRPDEFSDELVAEMADLQDAVPPIPTATVRSIVERSFGVSVDELFASFEDTPLAAASVAQVHRATLHDAYRPVWGAELPAGAEVVVKVVRPGALTTMQEDIAVLRRMARRIARTRLSRRVDALAFVEEFAASIERELDLRNEGRFADRFNFDFRDDPRVSAPRIVWPLTSATVLTMEFIDGWRLSELDAARAAGVDTRMLAIHGATAFMRQVFVQGRYHADLHPANLLVRPDNTIGYLDFGIVGYLTLQERADITQVMAALVYRDADRALRYSARLGVHVPEDRIATVREGLGRLLDGEVRDDGSRDLARFGLGFLRLLGENGVAVPSGYGLLIKSLATVEGVARALYPDIDIVQVAQPFITPIIARSALDPAIIRERMPDAIRVALRELTR